MNCFLGGEVLEEGWYGKHGIDLLLQTTAKVVDVQNKRIHTDSNDIIYYEKLVIATGSKPIKLSIPGGNAVNCSMWV